MAEAQTHTRDAILTAATECLSLYGVERTSMADVAKRARVSRASIYVYFDGKEALFRAVVERVHDELITAAQTAAQREGSFQDRLAATLRARWLSLVEQVARSPHGAEVMAEDARIGGDLSADARRRTMDVLVSMFAAADRADELDLVGAGITPRQAAEIAYDGVRGLMHREEPPSEKQFTASVERFSRVLVRGLGVCQPAGDSAARLPAPERALRDQS
jgi:AcrR family transcriptional regulator